MAEESELYASKMKFWKSQQLFGIKLVENEPSSDVRIITNREWRNQYLSSYEDWFPVK